MSRYGQECSRPVEVSAQVGQDGGDDEGQERAGELLTLQVTYLAIFFVFRSPSPPSSNDGRSKFEYQLERTVLDIFREIKERKNEALKTSFKKLVLFYHHYLYFTINSRIYLV